MPIEKVYESGMITSYHYERIRRLELTTLFIKQIKEESHSKIYIEKKNQIKLNEANLFTVNPTYNKKFLSNNLNDWRARCKHIIDLCLESFGKHKVYFEKPLDLKIIPHRNQIDIPPSDLGTIRGLLIGTGKIFSAPYRNYFQFYKDMIKFWKNCRNNANMKAAVKASGIIGKKVFKKEWNRLFVEIQTKASTKKFEKNFELAIQGKNLKSSNYSSGIMKRRKPIIKKSKITMTKSKPITQSTSTTNLDSTTIHRLVEALASIAHDVESNEFRQMLEIIKTNNKLETDAEGVLEVDFGKLDKTSLEKLNTLANDLGLLK
jgi:hypothetical protein